MKTTVLTLIATLCLLPAVGRAQATPPPETDSVILTGPVRVAGRLDWSADLTASKALLRAGGYKAGVASEEARAVVYRGDLRIPVDLAGIVAQRTEALAGDVILKPGDIVEVIVPARH